MLLLLKINPKSLFTLKMMLEEEMECEADNMEIYQPNEKGEFPQEYYREYYKQAETKHEALCDVYEAIWRALENTKPAEM